MVNKSAVSILSQNKLKLTPQRIAILDVILSIREHPTAELVYGYLRLSHPHISIGTIYKTLDLFAAKGIITRIPSMTDQMKYDAVHEKHHHLYCPDNDRIEDFYDEELYTMISNYLNKKKIPNFTIEDFKLHVIGKFTSPPEPSGKSKIKKKSGNNLQEKPTNRVTKRPGKLEKE